jgi:hypothetical protein
MKTLALKFTRVAIILLIGMCSYNVAMAQAPEYYTCPPQPETLQFCNYWFPTPGPTVVCPGTIYTYTIQYIPHDDPVICWMPDNGNVWSQNMDANTNIATAEISWNEGPASLQVFHLDVTYGPGGTNPFGSCFRSQPLPITVRSQLKALPGGNVNICEWGPGVSLWANLHNASSYQWKKNGVNVPNGNNRLYIAKEEGDYTVTATKDGCTQTTNPPIHVNLIERPGIFIASGVGYSCLSNTAKVELSGSQSGVTYFLRTAAGALTNQKSGTGLPLTWDNVTQNQTYYVTARKTESGVNCFQDMAGNPISTGQIPAVVKVYNAGGSGNYCIGESGRAVTLSGSQVGVIYRLRFSANGTPTGDVLNGTGLPLTFPLKPAGSYKVTGEFAIGSCATADMSGTITIQETSLPNIFNVTVENYCSGQLGGKVKLDGSQSGVEYQLHKNGVPWGAPPIPGNGSALEWLSISPGGPYSVVGTNTTTGCRQTMTGPSVKTLLPLKFDVGGGGTACNAITETINLSGSEISVTYELIKDNVPTGVTVNGTGSPISWPNITAPGVYTVKATSIPGCTETMNKSATVVPGPVIAMTVSRYPCTYHFALPVTPLNDCGLTTFSWSFGDGGTATTPEAFHTYAPNNTYTATLIVTSTCNGVTCSNTTQQQVIVPSSFTYQQTTLQVNSDQRPGIINSSASTFSDSWVLPYELNVVANMNPFMNGERGVWRNQGNYSYKEARKQSTPINLATDGTYTMDFFNWRQASVEAIPNWIKASEITRYSPFSYQLEDKDVLNIYTAAVYDYGGHLASAEGRNMRNDEMAYTGFETVSGTMTGNWNMGNSSVQTSITVPVLYGYGHMAIAQGPLAQFTAYGAADVRAFPVTPIAFFGGITSNVIPNNTIVCRQAYTDPNFTVFVFDEAPFPDVWLGNLTMRSTFTASVPATRDQTVVHTGAYSLKITSPQTFPQGMFRFDQGKSYMVSAWVSIGNVSVASPVLGTNIGLDVIIKNPNGTTTTVPFQAGGPVIEGWQQVKGTFTVPVADAKIDINFRSGSAGTAYFDDLRLHPNNGSMRSFVYDLKDYRLMAILDEQNYASLFYYDDEGNLFLTKKDSERGRKTITENITYVKEN